MHDLSRAVLLEAGASPRRSRTPSSSLLLSSLELSDTIQKSMSLKYEPASEPQPRARTVQGYLTYKKTHPPRTLP